MRFTGILFLSLLLNASATEAQDLWSLADSVTSKGSNLTAATFKTTRLVNFQTVETVGKRTLDFRISHRFGALNTGSYGAWGIDGPANIRLGLEYSFDGRFMFGIGRSSFEKMIDGFLKYRLLRQTKDNKMPLSVTLFASAYRSGLKSKTASGDDIYSKSQDRFSYVSQLIIGRKFSGAFSLQAAPWFLHYNLVEKTNDQNDIYGVAFATRVKISKRMAFTVEYSWRSSVYSDRTYYDSMGIGWEIETGGHVFQVHLVNSYGIAENQFLAHTDSKWNDAGIRIGFNVSRVFTL